MKKKIVFEVQIIKPELQQNKKRVTTKIED